MICECCRNTRCGSQICGKITTCWGMCKKETQFRAICSSGGTFLTSVRKVPKGADTRGAESCAHLRAKCRLRRLHSERACGRSRASHTPPLCIPRPHLTTAQHLGVETVQSESVPDFLTELRVLRADGRKSEHFRLSLPFPRAKPGQEGWIKGGDGFLKSPLLCRLLFALFLPKQEKGIVQNRPGR